MILFKKVEVTNLYKKVDGIVEGVGEYKSISEIQYVNVFSLERRNSGGWEEARKRPEGWNLVFFDVFHVF